MLISQVACQLYTLRDFCKTAADLAATAKKVKAIGYAAVLLYRGRQKGGGHVLMATLAPWRLRRV